MEVEEYTYLKYFEMLKIVERESPAHVQGRPVIIVYSGQFTSQFLQQFFDVTFPILSKIVLEKESKHYLLCDKYEKECIEPFNQMVNVTSQINNNVSAIVDFIMKKYEPVR
jgi:hypothetical protein